eukprot:PITA_10659
MDLPQGKQVIGVKWVYKTKSNVDGKIERHKARLVVKGYKQQHGRYYVETLAPVARMEMVRTVVAISTQHKWKVYKIDVKSMFLNGVLKEIDAYLLDNGFNKCDGEPTLYIKENDGKILIVVLYVDDLIFSGSDDFVIVDFEQVMKNEFEMIDLGSLRYFLGIEVKQIENGIFISQEKYVLERFKMRNSKPTPTPTRPDIMYVVSLVSRFMETSKEMHWQASKMILR